MDISCTDRFEKSAKFVFWAPAAQLYTLVPSFQLCSLASPHYPSRFSGYRESRIPLKGEIHSHVGGTLWRQFYRLVVLKEHALMKTILVKVMFDSPHACNAQPAILPHPTTRIIQSKMSIVPKLRNPALTKRMFYKTIFGFFIHLLNKYLLSVYYVASGLPWRLSRKEFTCNAGDEGSISGWGWSPAEGNGNLPSILAWKIPWTEGPGVQQPMRLQKTQTWLID